MPDLRMSWGDYPGGYGTEITGAPATIDAGGVAVTVEYTNVAPTATAFALNLDTFDDPGDDLPSGSQLKLISDGGGAGDTSTTVLTFDSTDALFGDPVADLTFRIDDIDAGALGDIDGGAGSSHDDIVVIRAYDAAGNEIPVTITPGGGMTVTGQTIDGDTQGLPTDAAQSALIEIAGPVARVEIDLANGDAGEQEVLISDLLFTTTDPSDNADPIANPDTGTTPVDTLLEDIDVLGNDTDADGDPLTVTAATAPNGTVTINADGTLDYDPDPGFTGPDTITYTISDGNGGSDTSTVAITVTDDPNSLPVAEDDVATAVSEVLLENIDVLGNDSDPDGDPLTVTAASAANGTVTINGDGTLNYTSDTDFIGDDTITYTIDDSISGTDTATVIVTVNAADPSNTAPIAVNEAIDAPTGLLVEDIDVLGNDSDPDGDPLTVISATSPNGTVTINPDGTLDYQSDPGFEGTDNITYTISDGRGGTDEGVVRVSVRDTGGGNEAPTPAPDTASTPVDTLIEDLDVLANDSDPDGDPLTVTSASAENGTVTINPDFTLDYQPDPGFEGFDTITYVVDDGNGGTVSAPVTVTVGDPNELPVANDDAASGVSEVLIENIDVLGNDTDPDGDPLTVTAASAANGTVTINGDGTLNYTSDTDFVGDDTITYTIDDSISGTDTASVIVTISAPDPTNTAPIAVNEAVLAETDVLLEDIDILGNDSDPDGDPLTVISATSPNGTVTINPDGTLDYQSDPGFEGTDNITYTISDGRGGTDEGVVRVSVRDTGGGNEAPTPAPDTASTPVDTLIEDLDVLANDSDPDGDPLTVTSASAENGTVTINPDFTLDYQPDPGFEGFDTITYVVDDGNGGTVSAPVTVTVGDPAANSDPVANPDTATTPVDTLLEDIPVLGNDSDPDGDPLTVTAASAPNGTVTINGDGTLDYDPTPGFEGVDTITYSVSDGNGGTDVSTVTVTVGDPNEDPDANPDTSSTTADTPVTIFPLGNDTDPEGDPLTITSATAPNGTVTVSPDGTSVTYTPDPGFDDDVDSITYTISDGSGGTDTSSIQVLVGTPTLDGIVEGTAGDDLIVGDDPATGVDDAYMGDPEGDEIDNSDAIAPEAGAQDDIVEAGAGDDTVDSGLGDDYVEADEGDDVVTTGEGDDTVLGGTGDDDIDTGEGDDSVFSGDDNDTVTTGDGEDTVLAGIGDDVIDTSGAIPLIDTATFPSVPVDADPEDDRDYVEGDEGADLITTGDDADTIFGGEGNDTIFSGIDDDSVIGDGGADSIFDEHGADYVEGGEGDDTIDVGIDTFSDYIGDDPNLPVTDAGITFVTDPNTDDGRDTVFGGTGNDVITTGDDADSIDGGDDDDTINAGIDDDTVRGGLGDDSIFGGHGSDTIAGGGGDDYIDSGHTGTPGYIGDVEDALELPGLELNDRDVVTGGSGNDTILTGDDDDSVIGGQGNDFIDGGIDEDTIHGSSGNDTVLGGLGDDSLLGEGGLDSIVGGDGSDTIDGGGDSDTITGGAGADSIFGNDGEDSIIGATAGDTIDGGEGPTDFDTLDLRGAGAAENVGGRVTIDYDAPGSEGGVVNFLDATDAITGTARFDNIENVIPCFTPGTLIATPQGERRVEDLKAGDRVITRDNGIQEIRWCGAKELTGGQLAANAHLQPILIQAGALGDNLPERDILVSPQHRMLLTTDKAAMFFEEREVLIAAKHLTILEGVDAVESSGTTYIHIMFDQHEVVLSNGTWSESFQPGDYSLDGIGKEQRDEILELFPELATQQGSEAYQSARRTLKKYEAALLLG
ncbi:Ig-like domain-containing protein [Planktotalea sp.]|uniref:Ig-like domain-containing protein n=1 Tax=Planktotalea sp. TaxID=2029877 RepID=UPI003D6B95FB